MGYYTHSWAEPQRDISDVIAAAKAAKAARRGRAELDEPTDSKTGPSGGPTSSGRNYGAAAVRTAAELLDETPVPGMVVGGIWHTIKGFVDNL